MASTETPITTTVPPTEKPPHKHGTRDKSVGWYQPTLDSISEAQRDLLENYSHIPPSSVIPHILEIVSFFTNPTASSPALTSTARSSMGHPPLPLHRPTTLHRPLPLTLSLLPSHHLASTERRFPPRSRLLLRARPAETRSRWRAVLQSLRR